MSDAQLKDMPLEEIMGALTEEQAKFIIQASVIAGHLFRTWLEEGVKLSRMVKP